VCERRQETDGDELTRHTRGSHLEDATLWALVARAGRWLEVLECGRAPRDAAASLGRSMSSEELRLRVQVRWSMYKRRHRIRRRLHTACPSATVPLPSLLKTQSITFALSGAGEA
jgi:hypothetical protein